MEGRQWLSPAEPRVTFTGVIVTERWAEDCTLECKVVGTGQTVFTNLELALGQRFTLYFFQLQEGMVLHPLPDSQVVPAGPITMEGFLRIKETCAGIGGIGHGCMAGGATICAAMDSNRFAVHHLRRYYNGEVLLGNVNSDRDLLRLHLAGGSSPTLEAAGFPCQPFSRQGDGLAFQDRRAQAFWGVLRSLFAPGSGPDSGMCGGGCSSSSAPTSTP